MTDSTLTEPPSGDDAQPGGFDESLDTGGRQHDHWSMLLGELDRMGSDEIARRSQEIRLLLEQDGVTYNVVDDERRPHRPWRVDPVPLLITGDEWSRLHRGVEQRARLLDAVLEDLYGERRLLRTGVVPPTMVLQDPQYLRPCDGIRLPSSRQLITSGVDVVRDATGEWRALGHRTQAPSGAAYAIETRRVLSRVFPRLFRRSGVQRLAPFLRALRLALRNAAPSGVEDPTVVVLSPGPLSETAFEHASIAAQLGYPLVQGDDLQVHEGRVHLRTIDGRMPVHVILRRVDAGFCDPLELRPDSTLGVPGLVEACRTGTVSVVNPLGAGVLENAGLTGLLPTLSRQLLGEDLLLPQSASWWCGDDTGRSHVVANLDRLVVRPLSRAGLGHAIDTEFLTSDGRDELRRRIEAEPDAWVGQERLIPSTAPSLGADGSLVARPVTVRAFAVAHDGGYLAMTGGLARVASADPTAPISNRLGAVAKDLWVLGGDSEAETDFWLAGPDDLVPAGGDIPAARAAEHLFWLGRYVERAEFTVRLMRVVADRRNELQNAPVGPAAAALSVLLSSLTRLTGTAPGLIDVDITDDDLGDELASLLLDRNRPGSVAHAITRAFAAIDVLRDQLSVDTWLVGGSLQQILDEAIEDSIDDDEQLAGVLDDLLPGLLAFAGLGYESMVRDHAWRFMDVGRRLERGLLVSSLVGSALEFERSPAVESLVIESILTAGESIITYRRRYRSRARVARVLDLMVLDAGNPRALRFQLDRLTDRLSGLRHGLHPDADRPAWESELIELGDGLDRLDTTALCATADDGHRAMLVDLLRSVESDLRAASDAVESTYFMRLVAQRSVVTPVDTTGVPDDL